MARWIVVTTALKVAVGLVVDNVIDRTDLGDGRVRWLVACPQGAEDLIRLVPGVLSVDPDQTYRSVDTWVHVA